MSATQSGEIYFAAVNIGTASAPAVVPVRTGYTPVILAYLLSFTGTVSPSFKFNRGATDLSGVFDVAGVYSAVSRTRALPLMSGTTSNTIQITTLGTTVSVQGFVVYRYVVTE